MPRFSFGGDGDIRFMEQVAEEIVAENPENFFDDKPAPTVDELDDLHTLYQQQRSMARLARMMAKVGPHAEQTAAIIFKKIVELEASKKPIAVDAGGVSTLPTFDANSLSLDGLNKAA